MLICVISRYKVLWLREGKRKNYRVRRLKKGIGWDRMFGRVFVGRKKEGNFVECLSVIRNYFSRYILEFKFTFV